MVTVSSSRGHSHFGGAYNKAVKTHIFSTSVTQLTMTPCFYWKLMALTQWPPIFPFDLSPKASNFKISTANWLFQMILCTIFLLKVRNSIWVASVERELLSLKDQRLHSHPVPPLILDQNALSHPMTPIFFFFFNISLTLCPRVQKLVPYTFLCPPPDPVHILLCISIGAGRQWFTGRVAHVTQHMQGQRSSRGHLGLLTF